MKHLIFRALEVVFIVGAATAAAPAYASCTGQFAPGDICGVSGSTQNIPGPSDLSSLIDRNFGAPSAQGTILNRGASDWTATAAPILGEPGVTGGSLGFSGSASGTATIVAQAAAGTTTLTLPTVSGTFAASASSPIVLGATTGTLSCPTCVVGPGGALVVGTTPVSGATSGQVLYSDGSILQAYGITGTGNAVLSDAPVITGHPTIEGVTSTGATGTGNLTFSANPNFTGAPTTTSFGFIGSTSGTATVEPQSIAGTPTLKLPTTSGTLPSTAASPLVLNASTGELSCPTCQGSFNVQDYGVLPDGTDHTTAFNSMLSSLCTSPNNGGTVYFPPGGIVDNPTVSSISYNGVSGQVTVTLSAAPTTWTGLIKITAAAGTGDYEHVQGTYAATLVGSTLTYTISTGLTMTVSGATAGVVGVYRFDGNITLPSDTSLAPLYYYPHQCNFRFQGAGGGANWQSSPTGINIGLLYGNAPSASILDLRYQSPETRLDVPQLSVVTTPTSLGINHVSSPLVVAQTAGSISGTTYTCASNCGSVAVGQTLIGSATALTDGTTITASLGSNQWTVSHSQTVGSEYIYALSNGSGYAAGEIITLANTGGAQTTAASIYVVKIDANGGILQYTVGLGNVVLQPAGGEFTSNPTGFTQASSTGSGSGVVLNNPTFTGYNPKIGMWGAGGVVFRDLEFIDLSGSNTTPFLATSNSTITVEHNNFVCTNNASQDAILLGGDFIGLGGAVNGPFQGYGSQIRFNQFTNCNRATWAREVANRFVFSDNVIFAPSGQWSFECNAMWTTTARSGGNRNIGGIVENNLVELGGSPPATPLYFADINNCQWGYYSNNSAFDGLNNLYRVWGPSATYNSFNVSLPPGSGGTGTAVIGNSANVVSSNIIAPLSTPTTNGYGFGSQFYGEFNVIGNYSPGSVPHTSYPGGLIVTNGSTGQYLALGGTGGLAGLSTYRSDIDSYAIGTGVSELRINPSGGPVTIGGPVSLGTYPNDPSTGTTTKKLVKWSSTGAVITATTDTDGAIGIATGGTGTTGNENVATVGQQYCIFDGVPSAVGNYVTISSSTAGDCHDAGSTRPADKQIIGQVASTTASSGSYLVSLQLGPATPTTSYYTNSLSATVDLNNTANFFDGPSVAQGTSGTWLATGSVYIYDTAGAANIYCKLWDGATEVADGGQYTTTNNNFMMALSGIVVNPAGNIRISCKDTTSTSGHIGYTLGAGLAKTSTVSVVRLK